MFVRIGLTSKLSGRRPSANVHWFALMHPLSGTTPLPSPASQTLQRETRHGAYSSLVPPTPCTLGCLTDASGLPADCLCRHAKSCSLQLADLTMWSSTCLKGCSPAMQEATVKGLPCGQEASKVLRTPLADSTDVSRKSDEKLERHEL